jgi:hypothetical protein
MIVMREIQLRLAAEALETWETWGQTGRFLIFV